MRLANLNHNIRQPLYFFAILFIFVHSFKFIEFLQKSSRPDVITVNLFGLVPIPMIVNLYNPITT